MCIMPIRCTVAKYTCIPIESEVLVIFQVVRLAPVKIEGASDQFGIDRDADIFVALHIGRDLKHPPDVTGHVKPAFIFVQHRCNCMADGRQVPRQGGH